MRTTEKKEEQKQEFTLQEAFVMWRNESKNGGFYLKGQTSDKKVKLVGFFNSKKKNPKEPDVRIYSVNAEGNQDLEVAALWEVISEKTGTRYLTGQTNDNEKLRGFYGKENQELRPYIRVYYK